MTSTAAGIHVTRWGTSGPEVLMIHGGVQGGPGAGVSNFSHQEPLGDHGWQVVVPDRPGHGETPSRGGEDMEVDGVWVAEMLGDGAHLVGHSYGGCIAVVAATLRPEAVRSLTLLEAPLFGLALDDPAVREFAFSFAKALMADLPTDERITAFLKVAGIPDSEGPQATSEEREAMSVALTEMRPPVNWDSAAAFAAVVDAGIDVLAVTGGWSPGFEVIHDVIAERSGGERLVVETGHHFPQWGAGFNAPFEAFLSGVEAR